MSWNATQSIMGDSIIIVHEDLQTEDFARCDWRQKRLRNSKEPSEHKPAKSIEYAIITMSNDNWGEWPLLLTTNRSEEHTSELQSLIRTSYDVFCLQKKTTHKFEQLIYSSPRK